MENLIEKLKGLDKKVWIGIGIGAAVVIILIVALIIGSGNDKPSGSTQGSSQGNSQVGTQAGTQAGTEGIGTENLGTEMTTEIETEIGTETEMTESESQSESQSQGGGNQSNNNQGGTTTTPGVGGTTVTQPEDVDGVEQKPITTTPDGVEILGLGSKDEPYEVLSEATDTGVFFTTVEIPAGKTLYYRANKIGGMWINIDDPDLYVIDSANVRHDSGFVIEKALASDFVLLQIGNKGSSSKAFTIYFSDVKGSRQNPERVSSVGVYNKSLSSGNEIGYYYKYVAQQTGVLKFYVSGTKPSAISVTNYRNSANQTTNASEDVKTDANGLQYVQLEVNAGDEIEILVHAQRDGKGRYPATDITWEMKY